MLVTAKCTERAWDSMACVFYYPGQEYEIERDGALAGLKTPTGRWVFQFDREATSLSASPQPAGAPILSPENTPDPAAAEVQEAKPEDRRGKTPPRCKGCGESFPNVNVLVRHKKVCPAKVEVVSEQVPQEATV